MSRTVVFVALLTLAAAFASAEDATGIGPAAAEGGAQAEDGAQAEPAEVAPAPAGTEQDPKEISGMSILGNQEAPKSLVIVPWKSSELGRAVGISTLLDDSRQPVDREVFLRALGYYEIRSETRP